jgi:hypothetical protein
MNDQPIPAALESEAPIVPPGPAWFGSVMSVLFIIFCLELGLFLLIYPWTDWWASNYFAWSAKNNVQHWNELWNNTYVRGAISGIGAVNLWIALTEVFRLFTRRRISAQAEGSVVRSQQSAQAEGSVVRSQQSAQAEGSVVRAQQSAQAEGSVVRAQQSPQAEGSVVRSQQSPQAQGSVVRDHTDR